MNSGVSKWMNDRTNEWEIDCLIEKGLLSRSWVGSREQLELIWFIKGFDLIPDNKFERIEEKEVTTNRNGHKKQHKRTKYGHWKDLKP